AQISDGTTTRRSYSAGPIRVGVDSDGDGLLDSYETAHGLDAGTNDAQRDTDLDLLTNGQEASLGSLPTDVDTDDGGEHDGREALYGRNLLSSSDDVVLPV